jgi:hypothetical protein
MAQVEPILNLLYNVGEHLDPRAAAVSVAHVPSGPPEHPVYDLACGPGSAQSIGERMAEGMVAGLGGFRPGPLQEPREPFLIAIGEPAAAVPVEGNSLLSPAARRSAT